MKKRISFEPVHYPFPGEGNIEKEVIINGKAYSLVDIDARSAARYLYHHPITRLVDISCSEKLQLGHSLDEIRVANSILEKVFNSNREHLLDSDGNTHTPNILTGIANLFTSEKRENYIVIPTHEQFEDILGLGSRAEKRGSIKGILGIGMGRILDLCKEYQDNTNWNFPIARYGESKTCGRVTLKLSSRGFRFSID